MPSKIPTHQPPRPPASIPQYVSPLVAALVQERAAAAAAYRTRPERAADNRFYCSKRWKAVRLRVLAEEPLCRSCQAVGRLTAAREVHHQEPRKLRPDLAFDRANLEPLCHACHLARRAASPFDMHACTDLDARP